MEEDPDFDAFWEQGANANYGSATPGIPSFGGISDYFDEDWFEVTLIAGHNYEIQVRGSETDDGTLRDPAMIAVYDDVGMPIPSSGDDNSGIGLNSLASFTPTYSGTHYLSVGTFGGDETTFGGTYTLEYFDLSAPEALNEGDDITLSIQTEIPSAITEQLTGSDSLDDYTLVPQISVLVTSQNAIEGEDFTVSYSFGQTQTLNFAALRDELVEDDESVSVNIQGTVTWNGPGLEGPLESTINFTRNFTINSAPFGIPDPIQDYSFTEPGVIGNVLTNFADGSEEPFSAVPFTFDAPNATGELLANGDLIFTSASGTPGQSVVLRFTAIDDRGATTQSEQIVEFGAPRDDYLPGETALELGNILIDTIETGSVERPEDRDRFVVTLEAGQIYSVGLTSATTPSGTLADPMIFGIYDDLDGLVPGSTDNNGGDGLDALLDQVIVDTSGDYQIEVGSFTPFGIGGYELSVASLGAADDFLPGPFADSLGSAVVDVPTTGSVERPEDRDRFVVTLEAGQIYSVGLTSATTPSGTLADPMIFGIYDDLDGLVPGSTDNNGGDGLDALLDQVIVDTSGDYQIEVGSFTPLGIGGYELSVAALGAADDFLPGPFADSLGSAVVDVPTTGTIELEGDRDRFEVALQAGVRYDISLEGSATGGGSNPNPAITGVFSSTGAFVQGSADNNSGVETNALVSGLTVEADGIYQVEVAGAQGLNIGDYTLSVNFAGFVDDFLPGIAGGVGTVAVGGRTTGEIETTGDIDAFRVTLQPNATFQIAILGQESTGGTLLDPDLIGIFSSSDLSGAPIASVQTLNQQRIGDDSISYFTPQTAGDFFIGVQDAFGGLGTYTVEVTNLGFRDDFSADADTTGTITPGGSASGRINFAQDNDWFKVNLAAGRLYEISLVPTGATALADPFFRGVYDSDGVLIQNTSNDDGGTGTSSALQFVTDESGVYYLSAGGFGDTTGQYRLDLNDLGPLDDGQFDITIEFTSDVSNAYVNAIEDAVERWEEIIVGDLPYAFVEGYGYVDDILIEVAVEDIELTFEGVEQTILAISSVLDQRDGISGASALPTYSRIVINSEEVGALLNLDEFVANTVGRALGFGSLWEEFGIVRLIDGVATYTGVNGLREMSELSDDLNGATLLEDGADGALAAEYWSEAVFDEELMTPRVELRRPEVGPGDPNVPDNPISALTIAAMQDLGYQVDYGEADRFRLDAGALSRQSNSSDGPVASSGSLAQSTASKRLLADLPESDSIPNGAAYIYARPNLLSESLGSFSLTDANTFMVPVPSPGTNAFFIESATGETLNIELKGTFAKNNPTELSQLSGTVESMEVRSLDGDLLFSVDYTQQPVSVAEIRSQWPNYSMDDENIIIIDTLPGTVVRVNPNGGGETANRIFTGASDDFVRGGDLAELINGGADNDPLEGGNGNDSLVGETGDDVLEGGRGTDLLNGGAGIDTAVFSGAQSAYTLTLGPDSTMIEDRRGNGNGEDRLINIEILSFDTNFGDDPFDLQKFGGPTGLSAPDFESFIELYIAYFNRAPDAVGLNFWGTQFAQGTSLNEMAALFVGQPETQATYPKGTSIEEFAETVYNNVLGRTPDASGFDFWVNELETGRVTRDAFILDVLRGAKADLKPEEGQAFVDQQLADREYLSNKTDIGAYFAVHKGMSDVENASRAMALFTGSQESISEAVSAIDQFHDAALNANSGEFLMPVIGVLDDPFSVA